MEVIMDCCSKEKKETLCELAKNKNIEELKNLPKMLNISARAVIELQMIRKEFAVSQRN
jgi:hypothetical protein